MNNCRSCAFCGVDGEGWEQPQYDYYVCVKGKGRDNLTTFPFKNTKCKDFVALQGGQQVRTISHLETKEQQWNFKYRNMIHFVNRWAN